MEHCKSDKPVKQGDKSQNIPPVKPGMPKPHFRINAIMSYAVYIFYSKCTTVSYNPHMQFYFYTAIIMLKRDL